MTITEKRLKRLMIENGFLNHLHQRPRLLWSDTIDVGVVREFITICIDWLKYKKQYIHHLTADDQIDWYENYKRYFPTYQLFEEFVEIVENNKCDYGCRQPQREMVDNGYITQEFYNKYWNY
jgi:hypothetical protein